MPATSRQALAAFAATVKNDFESWYERHARACYRWYIMLQAVVFVSSIITAVIAALSNGKNFDLWAKYVVVVLPLLGAFATTLLSQLQLYQLWRLREEGRIAFQAIALDADLLGPAAKTDEECSKIHEGLLCRLNEVEVRQSATFFGLYKDMVIGFKNK